MKGWVGRRERAREGKVPRSGLPCGCLLASVLPSAAAELKDGE